MYFKNIYKTLGTTGTEEDESQKASRNGPLGSINKVHICIISMITI